MTIEGQSKNREVPVNPLSEQLKKAAQIENLLDATDSRATINVWGSLHAGIIGDDLKDAIKRADVITLELPSVAIDQEQKGNASENAFWRDIIITAEKEGKRPIGVNNNRSAVNGIRFMDQRVREGQKAFRSGPHLVVSGRSFEDFPEIDTRLVEMQPEIPQLIKILDFYQIDNLLSRIDFEGLGFGEQVSTGEENPKYATFLQISAIEDMRIAVATGKWATPMEMWMKYSDILGGQRKKDFPDSYSLVEAGLNHLMRLRVDKTQVDGMLTALQRNLKDFSKKDGRGKNVNVLHIGGAAHNGNLGSILTDLFGNSERVKIEDSLDGRMVKLGVNALTFFSGLIPLSEGLVATDIYHDQLFFNIPKTLSVLKGAIDSGDLVRFRTIGDILDRFNHAVPTSDDDGDFKIFYVDYLLSLLPNEMLDDPYIQEPTNDLYPDYLTMHLKIRLPEQSSNIDHAYELYKKRKEIYPLPEPE